MAEYRITNGSFTPAPTLLLASAASVADKFRTFAPLTIRPFSPLTICRLVDRGVVVTIRNLLGDAMVISFIQLIFPK